MPFPAETVPDGALFGPHYFLYSLYLVLFACARKWDLYPRKEPVLVAGSACAGLFGWVHLWRYYPAAGATLCLLGAAGTVVGGLVTTRYGLRWRLYVVWTGLVATDDAISHAFGVWTPIDAVLGGFWATVWRVVSDALLFV
ncbi:MULTISPECIES: hypothetical protein [Halorussus]|uniref:hypothetical protein n=1 Tax=Halorussus TaxID=1070314 RepID=UPI00209EA86E|nr:hypothetical protein [Halorussus vallis]USZ74271.1 hypothetical protein NGM07_12550 [Halorussus vallis]